MNNNEVKEHACEIVCLNDFICSDCSKEEIEACPHKQLLQLQVENEQLTQKLEKAKSTLSELVNMFFSDLEDFEIVERLNEYYLKQLKEAKQALKELNT